MEKEKIIGLVNQQSIEHTKNKKEAIEKLNKISNLITNLEPDLEPDFYEKLLQTNESLRNLLKIVIGNRNNITRDYIENISEDYIIQTMLEIYCNISNIDIKEVDVKDFELSPKNIIFKENQTAIETYIQEISLPLLNEKEQKELLLEIQKGNSEAKNKLIERNLRLVVFIAKKYKNSPIDIDDLIQEGNQGLMHALDLYDTSKNIKFSTYASYWIRASIKRYIENNNSSVRIPAHYHWQINRYINQTDELTMKLGRTPTREEILSYTGLSESKLTELEINNQLPMSLNVVSDLEDDGKPKIEFENLIPDSQELLENKWIRISKKSHLKKLFEKSDIRLKGKIVISLRYGLTSNIFLNNNEEEQTELKKLLLYIEESIEKITVLSECKEYVKKLLKNDYINSEEKMVKILEYIAINKEKLTLQEVGEFIGTTRERVRQIENRTLQKIRKTFPIEEIIDYSDNPAEAERKLNYFRQFPNYIPSKEISEKYENGEKPLFKTKSRTKIKKEIV